MAIVTSNEYDHIDIVNGSNTNRHYIKDTTARNSIEDLKSASGEHSDLITANLMGVDVQQNLYPGAADWSGEWIRNSATTFLIDDTITFDGYPVVKDTVSWRSIKKDIPVESGKTYTFQAYVKATDASDIRIYIDSQNNPATTSATNKRYTDTPNNVWTRIAFSFSCTASGNVRPCILSAKNGDFYIAKYSLVEGDKVFSLSDALDNKVTKNEISAIGDYEKYSFSLGTSTGVYWNNYIDKNISAGDKIRLIFGSYSGNSALTWVKIDGKKSDGTWDNNVVGMSSPVHGDEAVGFASNNYVQLRVQFYRATDESNATGSVLIATNHELGIANDLLSMKSNHVFHVELDGSGDFTSFVEGINEACKFMDSIVYVGAGTYDLLSELGSTYVSGASSSQMGLVLKNRVHVICSSQTILEMDYDGSLSNAKEYLSPINTGEYGCTLENATIIDNNVRYSIHDDRGWSGSTPYTNKFINCTLIHKNGKYGDCIGGGLGENAYIEIRGCYLEGDSDIDRLAYYHGNNHTGVTDAKGHIVVCDNYFANDGSFWLQKYGDSTEMSTALVSNNSFGSAPQITSGEGAQDNMRMIAWNNEVRS